MKGKLKYMQRFEVLTAVAFVIIVVLLGVDLFDDLYHGSDLTHVALEATAFLISSVMLGALIHQNLAQLNERHQKLSSELSNITAERNEWRARSEQYIQGLSAAIDQQFAKWRLSESESEIGLFVLKGLSHKEIALLRQTSERTVRQQAAAIYAKSGLENKAQLSAFFLEDLMLPGKSKS